MKRPVHGRATQSRGRQHREDQRDTLKTGQLVKWKKGERDQSFSKNPDAEQSSWSSWT